MAEVAEDLAKLVTTVVTPLVNNEEDLSIEASEQNGNVLIEIHANAEDAAKVIGRQGRVIKAIRTLTRAAGSCSGVSVDVEYVD